MIFRRRPKSWTGVEATLATDLDVSSLSKPALALMEKGCEPSDYCDRLVRKRLFLDAVKLLAVALSPEVGALWACAAVDMAADDNPEGMECLRVAQSCAASPSPEKARACLDAAKKAEFQCAASWAAAAVAWSGGAMNPTEKVSIPSSPKMIAQAVVGAVSLAAVHGGEKNAKSRYRAMIALGADMAATPRPPGRGGRSKESRDGYACSTNQ